MTRIDRLRDLAATDDGLQLIDALVVTFAGKGVDRRVSTICKANPKVRADADEYLQTLRAAIRKAGRK
jgi:hypothetical protein